MQRAWGWRSFAAALSHVLHLQVVIELLDADDTGIRNLALTNFQQRVLGVSGSIRRSVQVAAVQVGNYKFEHGLSHE